MKRSTAGASLQLDHLGLLTINGLQELEKHRTQQSGLAHGSQRFNGCGRHTVTPHRFRVKLFEVNVLKNLNYLDQKQPKDLQTYCSRSAASPDVAYRMG
jgi:hypothetical protein